MLLGRVIGNVWGARQAARLDGERLLLVKPLAAAPKRARRRSPLADLPGVVVAVDQLGAGPGELVLVAHSSRCRDLTVGSAVPTKAVVMAIVDQLDLEGGGGAAP